MRDDDLYENVGLMIAILGFALVILRNWKDYTTEGKAMILLGIAVMLAGTKVILSYLPKEKG